MKKKILVIIGILFCMSGCSRLTIFNRTTTTTGNQAQTTVSTDDFTATTTTTTEIDLTPVNSQFATVAEMADKCTLVVENYTSHNTLSSFGSGVIYKKVENTYYLITNEHVVSEANKLKVRTENGIEIDATLIASDATLDIAIVKFETTSFTFVPVVIESAPSYSKGEFVIAVGTPLDFEYYNTATMGIISRVSEDVIQHDAAINSGNSGGPLFDLSGNLIGINQAKYDASGTSSATVEGIGFSIPIEKVKTYINSLSDTTARLSANENSNSNIMLLSNTVLTEALEVEEYISGLVATLEKSVVTIYNQAYDTNNSLVTQSMGSGVIYKKVENVSGSTTTYTYYIITNNHVVDDADAYKLYDGEDSEYTAELVATDENTDLALLKATTIYDMGCCELGSTSLIEKGQIVLAIGTPLDSEFYNTVTLGMISRFDGTQIQHDAAITSGNSGGPLFDLNGYLVGINNSKLSDEDINGIGFAIPILTVKTKLAVFEKKDVSPARPVLGISVVEVADIISVLSYNRSQWVKKGGAGSTWDNYSTYSTYISSGVTEGLFIVSVTDDSIGDVSGLEVYDVIVGMNGIDIDKLEEFQSVMWNVGVGGRGVITINRSGVEQDILVQF